MSDHSPTPAPQPTAKHCSCMAWQDQLPLINGPFILAQLRAGSSFDANRMIPWKVCPWCGSSLDATATTSAPLEHSEPCDYCDEVQRVSELLMDFDPTDRFPAVSLHLEDLLKRLASRPDHSPAAPQEGTTPPAGAHQGDPCVACETVCADCPMVPDDKHAGCSRQRVSSSGTTTDETSIPIGPFRDRILAGIVAWANASTTEGEEEAEREVWRGIEAYADSRASSSITLSQPDSSLRAAEPHECSYRDELEAERLRHAAARESIDRGLETVRKLSEKLAATSSPTVTPPEAPRHALPDFAHPEACPHCGGSALAETGAVTTGGYDVTVQCACGDGTLGGYARYAGEMILRRGWWLSHGCDGLYGDDGEMSCGACMIDFKRDDPREIQRKIYTRGLRRLTEHFSVAAAVPAEAPSEDSESREWTPELLAKLVAECDRVPDTERAKDLLAEAREALHRVGAPSSPDTENVLYYPLLFLCESVAPVLAWLDDDSAARSTPTEEKTNAS